MTTIRPTIVYPNVGPHQTALLHPSERRATAAASADTNIFERSALNPAPVVIGSRVESSGWLLLSNESTSKSAAFELASDSDSDALSALSAAAERRTYETREELLDSRAFWRAAALFAAAGNLLLLGVALWSALN